MKKKHIPIFMAADDEYLPYLTVTLKSISLHSSREYIYDVRILSSGFQPYNVRKLRHMRLENLNIMIVNMNDIAERLRPDFEKQLRDYYSESIFYRLFIAEMYPRLTKAIYIDSDVVLNDDIARLYFEELGDNILGGITDETILETEAFSSYAERWVGVPAEKYINSGVLLMNLKAFREAGILDIFTRMLVRSNPETVAPDQDYLNFLCQGRIKYLDGGWNKQPKLGNLRPAEEQHLIHYNLNLKPWHYDDVPYSEQFWRIAMLTPFYDDIAGKLRAYSGEEKERDRCDSERLVERAGKLAMTGGGFAAAFTMANKPDFMEA